MATNVAAFVSANKRMAVLEYLCNPLAVGIGINFIAAKAAAAQARTETEITYDSITIITPT